MELSQVSGIQSLVSENSIYGEELAVFEAVSSDFVQQSGGHGCGVGPEDVLAAFLDRVLVPPADAVEASFLVHLFDAVPVRLVVNFAERRFTHEEGVLLVSGRMLLWNEEGIKVPEGILNIVVGAHLFEAALGENTQVQGGFL